MAEIYVVKRTKEPLLARDVSEGFGVVKRVNHSELDREIQ